MWAALAPHSKKKLRPDDVLKLPKQKSKKDKQNLITQKEIETAAKNWEKLGVWKNQEQAQQ